MSVQALYEEALGSHKRGDLAAAENLYRQVLEAAPASFAARHMLGILRAQQGALSEALDLLEAAVAQKPEAHDALFNYGHVLKKAGRIDEALTAFGRALDCKPDYQTARIARAELLNLKGNRLRDAGQHGQALAVYGDALADVPHYADALNNRATALWSLGRFEEALTGFDAALASKPEYVEAWFNRGNALRDLLRPDEAMQSYDRATAIDPAFAPAYRNKGFCALLRGDFAQGLPLYEWRKRLNPPIESRTYLQPLWTGREDIKGKTMFVYIEQGLGDAIQFYRFVGPLLERGARVILSAQDGLLRLLENASPRIELVDSRTVPAEFDCHVPLMSLPLALGLTPDLIPAPVPYLKPEADRAARWKDRIGEKGFKIGISWQGARGGVTSRAMPLRCFEGLSRLEGVRLISLQKGFGTEQLADAPWVERLDEEFDSGPHALLDSAAVMQSLDLVITLDSALAHLAGALGRPVWLALKQVPDWRWFLGRSDSPWYPSMRLFRQQTEGDWARVFAEMEAELCR
ncbi:MAG TPA: tetratricopeptide repeat protein [Rhizomicrobium sp.]|nr:tetratricopeptide repeat protein [Rhizomicrobium sp.]